MTIHERAEWVDPAYPIVGPRLVPGAVQGVVIHYQGSGGRAVPADIAAHVRSMQRDWAVNRGYSLGYSTAVVSSPGHPLDGHEWIIRGEDTRQAATAGVNAITVALLVIQVDNERATDLAAGTIRARIGRWTALCGRPLAIWPHGAVPGGTTATACPGAGLRADIAAGRFAPPQPPPDHPPTEATDMLILDHRIGTPHWVRLVIAGGVLRWVRDHTSGVLGARVSPALPRTVTNTDDELRHVIRDLGCAGPSPWDQDIDGHAPRNPTMHTAWATGRVR